MKAAELRKSILQATVEGKLVPQDPNDEPASELLKRIKQEKERLIRDGKIKKEKPLSYVSDDEIPFELPEGWEWCRLGNLCLKLTDGAHTTPKYTDTGVPFLSVKDISNGKIDFSNTKFISHAEHKELYKRCNPEKGDLLLTKVGTTGIPVIVDTDEEFSLFVSVALLKLDGDNSNINFIKHLINTPLVATQAQGNTRGVGNKNWVLTAIANTVIAMPPLCEQERIVAKLDALMAMCDELETAEKELDVLESQFAEYLPKSILQAAVQGNLVAQDPNDEPATELLKRIKQEKDELIRDGKIKKEKSLPPVAEDEIPYDLPEGWIWCRITDCFYSIPDKQFNVQQKDVLPQGKYPVVSQGKDLILGYTNDKSVVMELSAPIVIFGDHTRQIKYIDFNFATGADGVKVLCPVLIDAKYFYKFLLSADVEERGYARHFSRLKKALFPLPPLAEQQRIVAKANELVRLCDELKMTHTLPFSQETVSIIPFPQISHKSVASDKDIRIAARGNAKEGLVGQAALDADELLGDD